MESFNLENLVNTYTIERLGEVYRKDEKYKKLITEEDTLYEELIEQLPDEEADKLEKYFEATNATSARKEILTYIQGMKDMFALFKALS